MTMLPEPQSFFRVHFDQFQVGEKIPFNIYTNNGNTKELLVKRNTLLSDPLYESLMDAADLLFFRQQDLERINFYIGEKLAELVRDPEIEPEIKSRKIHLAATKSLKALFDEPVLENALQAREVINATTDLIIQSEEARRILFSLAGHDYYTYTHSCNVGMFGLGLAKALIGNRGSFRAKQLGQAFFFHDIGKVKIDSKIIQKPDRLNAQELEEMKKHPDAGLRLLEKFRLLTKEARDVVLQHHEKLDGTGYPRGLTGPLIHPFARICAVVDVFDALTSERPYRRRNTPFEACRIMQESENAFDPKMLKAFIRLMESCKL